MGAEVSKHTQSKLSYLLMVLSCLQSIVNSAGASAHRGAGCLVPRTEIWQEVGQEFQAQERFPARPRHAARWLPCHLGGSTA